MNGGGRVIRALASTLVAVGALVGAAGGSAARQATTVTDVQGRAVTVDGPPERVVCLVSLCDDMLLELGMRPVARTGMLLEHPAFLGARADQVPQVPGGFLEPDAEAIIGYEPDLVIGSFPKHEGLAAVLEGTAPLWLVQSNGIEDSIQYLRDLGTLTGLGQQAAEAEQRFRDKLAQADGAHQDLTALVVYGYSDDTFQVATGSYLGELIARIFAYPWKQRGDVIGVSNYSVEDVIATDADVLFVMTYKSEKSDPDFSEVLADDPVWGQLTAVKNGAVYEVSTDLWGDGRGTRSLGAVIDEALELVDAGG